MSHYSTPFGVAWDVLFKSRIASGAINIMILFYKISV